MHVDRSLILLSLAFLSVDARADDLPPLRWGGDKAGGAPFIYEEADGVVGFEYELAELLGRKLGREPVLVQCDWDAIPDTLLRGNVDVALNGLEYIPEREGEFASTVPYFVYTLRLIVAKGDESIRGWEDLETPRDPRLRVGVLRGSFAQRFLEEKYGEFVDVIPTKEVDETFQLVEAGERLDATVQDSPAAAYYVQGGRRPGLKVVGEPASKGFYVILTKPRDERLREQLNVAIKESLASGELEAIYSRYGLWDADQERLAYAHVRPWPPDDVIGEGPDDEEKVSSGISLSGISGRIAAAAWMTIKLSCLAMPLAIVIGLLVAVGRMYGPRPLRWLLTTYVEVLRGTPILLQMYVWFFLIPNVARSLGGDELAVWFTAAPFWVGVFGLAINYSAAEAENYRAGLQAIPRGQMEAALALGMSPATAIYRVMIPQAFRIVIPPVTNDFIALFKDTSICSMILITELTGLYYQYKYDRELVLQLALTIGLIYLLISYPLSLLASTLEKRLARGDQS